MLGPKTVKGAQSDPNYISRLLCGDNVRVSLLVWRTRYTDTFCNAVDCRFELALQVQRWSRARIPNLKSLSTPVMGIEKAEQIVVYGVAWLLGVVRTT